MSMICSDNSLHALHRVLICTRSQAYEKTDPIVIGDVMDVAEYLVAILQNHEGLAEKEGLERFRIYLAGIEARFPNFCGLALAFDTPIGNDLNTMATA